MKALQGWLRDQAARERRVVYLEDALLIDRYRAYAAYRLRFFLLRYLAESALHGLKFLFLRFLFAEHLFIALVALTAAAALAGSFWWGGLEVMRAQVRRLAAGGRPHLAPAIISDWLARAAAGAGGVLALAAAGVAWSVASGGTRFTVLHLSVLAVAVRLALDLLVLTFHSGVYAIRRVYRPLPAIVAAELAGFVATLGSWPWLGAWSFPLAILVSSAVSAALATRYTSRLYRFLGFLPLPWPRPGWLSRGGRGARPEFLAAGASYALMRLDAFLVLALLTPSLTGGRTGALFLLLFSISPTIRAGFDWAQLFYFDLKRLEIACFRNLRKRYEAFLARLAWGMGALFWVLAVTLAAVFYRADLGAAAWLLGPFLVSRSVLACAQVRAFAQRRYGALLGSGLAFLPGLAAVRLAPPDDHLRLGLLTLAAALALGVLRVLGGPAGRAADRPRRRLMSLRDWVAALGAAPDRVRVGSIRLSAERGGPGGFGARWRQRRLAEGIARRLGDSGAVTTVHGDRVTWYETGRRPLSESWLLAAAGGLVASLGRTKPESGGRAALVAAARLDLLGPGIGPGALGGGPALELPAVRRAFGRMVPGGVVYAPDAPLPAVFAELSSRERRGLLSDAVHFATQLRPAGGRARFEVTALCRGEDLELMFLVDRHVDPRSRARWTRWVRRTNLQAALVPARELPGLPAGPPPRERPSRESAGSA